MNGFPLLRLVWRMGFRHGWVAQVAQAGETSFFVGSSVICLFSELLCVVDWLQISSLSALSVVSFWIPISPLLFYF